MLTLHDTQSSDLAHVMALAVLDEGYQNLDYVKISDPERRQWIGQIIEANRNLSVFGDPLAPAVRHGLELLKLNPEVIATESILVYEILLFGRVEDGQLSLARTRPLPGADVQKMPRDEVIALLGLPKPQINEDSSNVIGLMINAENVPACVEEKIFRHHVMVDGGTGSGKSNVGGNLIEQAVLLEKCVLVHDVKPDYRLIANPNSDPAVERFWPRFKPYKLEPHRLSNIVHIGFHGECDPNEVDQVVGFSASDFSPFFLGSLFFNAEQDVLQYEAFVGVAQRWKEADSRRRFTVRQIVDEINRMVTPADTRGQARQQQIAPATADAITRKTSRIPSWLDCVDAVVTGRTTSPFDRKPNVTQTVQTFNLNQMAKPGRVILIDYGAVESYATYAVLLGWFLHEAQQFCRRVRNTIGIVEIIDEANRLFEKGTRHAGLLANSFARAMREGRSKDHSLVLALQNVDEVPNGILQNIHSHIVMRQNNRAIAKRATEVMGEEFEKEAMRLGTGEALIKLHESRFTVLAQMAPSPFELMRTDNTRSAQAEREFEADREASLAEAGFQVNSEEEF